MQNAARHMDAIVRRIRRRGCVLMLDFDGVLSPIVRSPTRARISAATKQLLAACTSVFPVAIISGRSISDVMKRTDVVGIIYAGSHGLEWSVNGRVSRKKLPRSSLDALRTARRALRACMRAYPGLTSETKYHCFAVNYRTLPRARATRFRAMARAAVRPHIGPGKARFIDHLCTFEILPDIEWTKGECARFIYDMAAKGAKKKPVPVYIGDSLTDEDAFGAFPRGVTIRVGKDPGSAARYYFASRAEVTSFLKALAGVKSSARST